MNRSPEQIKQDMLNHISKTEDKSENSFVHDPLSAASIEFFTANRNLEYIGGKLDINNLEGGELDRFVYQRTGIKRIYSTHSVGIVIISGREGTSVRKGDLVGTDTVNFLILEDKVIDKSGQASVFVSSELEGSAGNVPAGSINRFPAAIDGLIDVYNPDPITNGYDEENDEELIKRYFDKLQRPGKAGNKYHYEEWAKEVVGVGGVRVKPRWDGPLTVKVVIIDSNRRPADEDLVAAVEGHIEEERPFGADVTVVSAASVEINVNVKITKSAHYEKNEVETSIKKKIEEYLQSLAFVSDYVSYARIGGLIIESDGVIDYSDLTVNGGTQNVLIDDEQIAVMGVLSCTY